MALTEEQVKNICKRGQGKNTCSYIALGAEGYFCAKGTPLQAAIDERREAGTMKAMGDNCEGIHS